MISTKQRLLDEVFWRRDQQLGYVMTMAEKNCNRIKLPCDDFTDMLQYMLLSFYGFEVKVGNPLAIWRIVLSLGPRVPALFDRLRPACPAFRKERQSNWTASAHDERFFEHEHN